MTATIDRNVDNLQMHRGEEHLDEPLDELRRAHGIDPAGPRPLLPDPALAEPALAS